MQSITANSFLTEPRAIETSHLLMGIGTLPTQWKSVKLGEIARVLYGKGRTSDYGTIPVIGSGGIYGYTTKPLVDHETLVIGRKGTAGCVYYSASPCYPSDTTFYLAWKEEVCIPFLYFSLLFKGLVPDKSVIPSLQRGDIENFNILLPPLPEQRAIAHVLQTVQNAIQARRKELELERERKAALMQHLFTHGTRGEPTKQTEIGKMPESWAVLKLGDAITLQRGFDITRKEQRSGTVPVISSSGILSYHDTAMVKGPGVIIGRKGSLGTAFYVEDDYWPHDTTLWVKDFHGNNPKFVYHFLKTLKVKHLDVGSSNPTLNRNHIHAIQVGLPRLDEQQEIATILQAGDSKITALEKEIALQEELFRALLDELITGRLSTLPLVE